MRTLWKSLALTTALACFVPACGSDESDDDPSSDEESVGRRDRDGGRDRADGRRSDTDNGAGPATGGTIEDDGSQDAGPGRGDSDRGDGGPARTGSNQGGADGGSGRATSGGDVVPGTATVRIVNEHPSLTVAELYLSPSDQEDWGSDQLQGRTIAPGGVFGLRGVPCEEAFDLRIVTATGSKSDQQGLVFECDEVSTITLSASPTQALRVLAP